MGKVQIEIRKNMNSNSKSFGRYYGFVKPYSTMPVEELTEHIAADSKVEPAEVTEIMQALFKQIKQLVCNGHTIRIPRFGLLRLGISSTGADSFADYNAGKNVSGAHIVFVPTKKLKQEVAAVKFFTVKEKEQKSDEDEGDDNGNNGDDNGNG